MNAIDPLGENARNAVPLRKRKKSMVVSGTRRKRARPRLWVRAKNSASSAAQGNVLPVRACSAATTAGARAFCAMATKAITDAISAG